MMGRKIIFKFDDYTGPTRRTRKLDYFVRWMRVRITWGVIGQALATWTEESERWSREALETGLYFFWNHGWTHANREFESLTAAEASNHLKKTQSIIKKRLGITPSVFGAPCNALNEETRSAVEAVEEIKYWYYGDPLFKGFCLKRELELEHTLFKPSFLVFVLAYMRQHSLSDLLVLQGHPNSWTTFRRINFYMIVFFLRMIGCRFVFPTEV